MFKKFFKTKPKEMVSYWKRHDSVEAKVMATKEGHLVMKMKNEKYLFPGYPRGSLLFGNFSKLKHQIKNKIFNDTWKRLEDKDDERSILADLKAKVLPEIFEIAESTRYDMVPFEKLQPPIKEIWRAMTKVEQGSEKVRKLKEMVCFILQEDDAYRFRFQWMVKFFNPNSVWRRILRRDPLKDFDLALSMLEHGEVIGDMKERQRLLRRILLFVLKDEGIRRRFDMLIRELDWKKLQLTKADKYFFRAKYFKVDFPEDQY